MFNEDKPVPATPGAVLPTAESMTQAPQVQLEQHEDRELSDKELESVSGGVWRNGRWYAR